MKLSFLSPLAFFLSPFLAQGEAVTTGPVPAARPFALGDVRLLDSPFERAMERNAAYLLSIDPDRLLHNTRQYAGLTPKGELYGGWEAQGIAGHTLGHYLTALAQQFAATGDARFRQRIAYIIADMAECQRAYGDGYIGALPAKELETMRGFKSGKIEPQGRFNFRGGAWVPWYTEHKVLNGLKDAWVLGGSLQAKEVTLKLADWVDALTASLTERQLQTMLQVEQGGMIDVMVELYALTGNPRYLATSRRFYHKAILDPLLAGRDELPGKHANTQIPKVIGEARTYEIAGDEAGRKIAENFWDFVVHRHSYVIGGNSEGEIFSPADTLSGHLGANTAETCNTYNMLKLTEHLFGWAPGTDYADFYERALYNHILASQEPRQGMFTYFMPLKPGLFKTYSTPTESFWCCVGSGMENQTKYGEAIYFHGAGDLYVNLFIPSVLTWKEKGLTLEQRTNYPEDNRTDLTFLSAPASALVLKVRCPAWAAGDVTFQLNGRPFAAAGRPGSYARLEHAWRKGDRLTMTIPLAVRTEAMPDAPDKIAFLYGPVLAGDLGPVAGSASIPYAKDQLTNLKTAPVPVPVIVRGDQPATAGIRRTAAPGLVFQAVAARPAPVTLRPFWEINYDAYTVYWDVVAAEAKE